MLVKDPSVETNKILKTLEYLLDKKSQYRITMTS